MKRGLYSLGSVIAVLLILVVSHHQAPEPPARRHNVRVTWPEVADRGVHAEGGGYRVYFSSQRGLSLGSGQIREVPYEGGERAPNSLEMRDLPEGVYYFRVLPFARLNATGLSGGQSPSVSEFLIPVPGAGPPADLAAVGIQAR